MRTCLKSIWQFIFKYIQNSNNMYLKLFSPKMLTFEWSLIISWRTYRFFALLCFAASTSSWKLGHWTETKGTTNFIWRIWRKNIGMSCYSSSSCSVLCHKMLHCSTILLTITEAILLPAAAVSSSILKLLILRNINSP